MAPTPEVSLTPPCDGIGERVPPVDVRGILFELQLFFIGTFSVILPADGCPARRHHPASSVSPVAWDPSAVSGP